MFSQNTSESKDGGCSGAKAFFTGAWISNSETYKEDYKGFFLSAHFKGYRYESEQLAEWKALKADWINRVDNELEEYDATSWSDYKTKYRERQKDEKQEEKKEREEREAKAEKLRLEGKDDKGDDNYQSLFKQVEELKKNTIKPLDLKEKDMKEIMDKIDKKNQEAFDKINKQVELKNDEVTKLAAQLQDAKKRGDVAAQNRINILLRKHQEELVALDKEKKELPTNDDLKELLKTVGNNSPVFDPKSGRFWLFSFIALCILIAIILLVQWVIKQIKTLNSSSSS